MPELEAGGQGAAGAARAAAASSQSSVVEGQRRQRTIRPVSERVCLKALAAQVRQRSCPQVRTKASVSTCPHSAQRDGGVPA